MSDTDTRSLRKVLLCQVKASLSPLVPHHFSQGSMSSDLPDRPSISVLLNTLQAKADGLNSLIGSLGKLTWLFSWS